MLEGGFNWELVIDWLPEFLNGAWATIWISFFSLIVALIVGLLIGLIRISRSKIAKFVTQSYVDIFRGTPVLIQIFFIYNGLPFFGIDLPDVFLGILAVGLNSSAYVAEILRGALEAIERGQMEAARSLGMSYGQAMRRIIIPQAVRIVIPPLTGEYNTLVKKTALLSVISIDELTRVGQRVLGVTFRPVEAWVPVFVIYFIINYVINRLSNLLEAKMAIPGMAVER
jgi:polar amino acid transport system permease protein